MRAHVARLRAALAGIVRGPALALLAADPAEWPAELRRQSFPGLDR